MITAEATTTRNNGSDGSMTETKGKKALSLCILRVLEQHASEQKPLSTKQIIELLKEDYGMVAERKAVGRNLILLAEMGFGLSTYHDNGKGYYLTSAADPTAFDPVIYDALLRAPVSEETDRRIRAMQPKTPIYSVKETPQLLRTEVFETMDRLRTAIEEQRQVTFLYHTAQSDDGMTASPDATYTISPYALFMANDRYYVLAAVSGYGRLLHFRCDYMRDAVLSELPARSCSELAECRGGLDVVGYVNRAVYHQDTAEQYSLLCAGRLVDEITDSFGRSVKLIPQGDNVLAQVTAPWTAVRRFLLNNLSQVTLIEPEIRQRQIRDELNRALSLYSIR